MKITFITPHVGRKSSKEYVRTWQMEPLTIATLVGLTPPDVEIAYYDERVESINFDALTDLAAITVETYTAKRAYEIAAEYHKRGVKTLLGGYHVTLIPDEARVCRQYPRGVRRTSLGASNLGCREGNAPAPVHAEQSAARCLWHAAQGHLSGEALFQAELP